MKKKCLAMLLAVVLAFVLLPGTAHAAEVASGSCGDNVTWSYSDGTLTIQGTGDMEDCLALNWAFGWDCAAPWLDYREQIHTVKIGDGVTSIGRGAFNGCGNLTSVTIPDSVTSIGQSAFEGCGSLTGVIIPDSVTSIEGFAFDGCSSLTSVTIPNGITTIEMGAFERCSNLAGVVIPNGVTSIGFNAFYNCSSLASVTIPDSVAYIGQHAFGRCGNLTSVTIPDSVAIIERNAFIECGSLTSVSISNSVTSIEDWTFAYSGLTGVTIPDSVTAIGPSAFAYCSNLTGITIPSSVTTIGEWAFDCCSSLKNIYYGGSENQWKQMFNDDDYDEPLASVTVHCNSTGPAVSFTDVPAGTWYEGAVQWAADKGYIKGNDGKFSPNDPLTRGAIFTILARVDGVDTEGGSTWYQKGLDWSVENGVSDGSNPTGPITLEELVTMLYRYKGSPGADTSVLDRFSDSSSVHTWTDFREAMAWAVETGLVQGGSDGRLDPLSALERSRGAMVLQRCCENTLNK